MLVHNILTVFLYCSANADTFYSELQVISRAYLNSVIVEPVPYYWGIKIFNTKSASTLDGIQTELAVAILVGVSNVVKIVCHQFFFISEHPLNLCLRLQFGFRPT